MEKKTKLAAIIATIGGACALCCTVPILGVMSLIGLGSLEAFFCENAFVFWGGIGLAASGVAYLVYKVFAASCGQACAVACGCKS